MERSKRYSPRIEKLLRKKGLLSKSIDEKKKSHKLAMELRKTIFTKKEREDLVRTYERIY